ncbi:HAAS signaling domain-containing protein [Mesobacillus zeae]|uniref:Uncharacterized protein n=1 Tax=Mesobacillus zeae TaxID=1917180 RepID=A0A398AWC1_9BACI|nr:hypothetical protein [Mesobacillus zeae]RID81957.1 hypothetical protein D1970_20535 [Mesobacillus zeae]
MDLIEVYIHEVTRRLPEKTREDIGLELRSTIEDMLPAEYREEDVKSVLEKMGNPAMLASGYQDKPMHLIGPRYFEAYLSLLKMILPIGAAIAVISLAAEHIFRYNEGGTVLTTFIAIMIEGVGSILEISFQTFFWVTLFFAILERTDKGKDMQPLTPYFKKWSPEDLKNIPNIPKKRSISRAEVFGSLLWTAIWSTVYFYANRLAGVYESGEEGLVFVTPSFNQEVLDSYWPVVLLVIGMDVALALYKFIKGQWTKKTAIFNTVNELLALVVFVLIINNQNLFQPEFIAYMSNLFTVTGDEFVDNAVLGSLIIYFIFAVISVFDGFRKARIR